MWKLDFLYVCRDSNGKLLVTYRTSLRSNFFYLDDKLNGDLYFIISKIFKLENDFYYSLYNHYDDYDDYDDYDNYDD